MTDQVQDDLKGSPDRFGYEWDEYAEILPEHEDQFRRWTVPLSPADWPGKEFLDVGCGMGRNSYWPLKYGAAGGVAVDVDERSLDSARRNLKPFPLMLGKIIGIGAVGLTQFLLWIGLIAMLILVAQAFIPHELMQEVNNMQKTNAMGNAQMAQGTEAARQIFAFKQSLQTANWFLIIGSFVFYFIGGYLFYSSLFAAVGSVVNEDPQEAQSLLLPISMPIIFSFIIMSIAVQDPGGPLALWASLIPFSSPIVMMSRIPYGVPTTVPYWQLLLSMALLAGGFLFTTWMAGRIYRTGILLYGKKPTWKTMWKWAFKNG